MLQEALTQLRQSTGLSAEPAEADDARVRIESGRGPAAYFVAQVKTVDRFRIPALVQAEFRGQDVPPMLIAPYVSRETAEQCRKLGLAFADTAGNAYIDVPGIFVWTVGNPRPENPLAELPKGPGEAELRVGFVLLCQRSLLQATYREIARAAGVSLGSVGPALLNLQRRGYVEDRVRLTNIAGMIREWVTEYPRTLRRKLNPRRFETGDPEALRKMQLPDGEAYWGGEAAAERLTGLLKPGGYTIYARGPITAIVAAARLRKAGVDGPVEVLTAFWDLPPNPDGSDLAPHLLVYADLLALGDGRATEIAEVIYERFLRPALG